MGTPGKLASCLLLVLLVASCGSPRSPGKSSGGFYGGDAPPDRERDVASIPDAVPRYEPLSRYGNNPYKALGKHYVPMKSAVGFTQQGMASWYGRKFHGRRTSSGETYDMWGMTAAHPVLPLPTYVRVTNLDNGRAVTVKVNDRGPFLHDRIIDLSYAAAKKLDIAGRGTGRVRVEAIVVAPGQGTTVTGEAPVVDDGQFLVQIAALSRLDSAIQARNRLQAAGYAVHPATHDNLAERGSPYRVQVGPFATEYDAQLALQRLLGDYPEAIVVSAMKRAF